MGLGSSNVWKVPTDKNGSIIPERLDEKILEVKAKNCEVLMVAATCGTTVLGAYDPLESIADLCMKYGIWLHVDVRST